MRNRAQGGSRRPAAFRLRAILRGRLPFVLIFGSLLLINWGMAFWLVHLTYLDREAAILRQIDDEARYAESKVAVLFTDADRALLELRSHFPGVELRAELETWPQSSNAGGIALIAPDGTVIAATPRASTAGWPLLMAQLAQSDDRLVIGEPVPGRAGHLSFVPVARRVVAPDGSFGGILMYSLEGEAFPGLTPSIVGLDGCMSVISDDGVILARSPDVRGTVGIRLARWPAGRAKIATGRAISPIDGVDRVYASHRLEGVPATLMVGVSHDVVFADWQRVLWIVVLTRVAASSLIILTAWLLYSRRHQAKISVDALATILRGIDHAVRVENPGGGVIAANSGGAVLQMPDAANTNAETRRSDGTTLQIARHDLSDGGKVLISTNVTERRLFEARVDFLIKHDPLTGLPNRWAATSRVRELLAPTLGAVRGAAVILFDLDGFRDINDTLGQEGGDEVLIEVAARLRALTSDQDLVARFGGDEFLIFVLDPDDEAAVLALARQIPRAFVRPVSVRGQQLRLGASMGIALCPRDGTDVTSLIRHADIALGRAKMAGRGTAKSFDQTMMVSFEEHRMMESDLRRALESDELGLHLQPQFSCETLEITGFEALARWSHPTRGDVSPSVFIPVAERSGLINALGLWAIEQACRAAAGWSVRHRVAVNVSPSQLRCETIQDDIRRILRRTQFPAHLLELEVTESVLLDEDQRTLETLHKLRAMDIRITLDDFGAGYSSLSYLRRFPFDKIKIDQSFIHSLGSDGGTRVILEAMIRMCTDLGFDVVGEGVETEHQLAELRGLGCREIQGFLLGRPMRPELVEEFLAGHARRLVGAAQRVEPAAT
jgi:diguanylate cyclase (GGDEF)-like protein